MKLITTNYLYFFFILLSALPGCMSDDRDDCPRIENVTLHFNYTQTGETFSESVSSVAVCVFEQVSTQLIAMYQVDRVELLRFEGIRMALDEGVYQIVCWGNVDMYEHTLNFETDLPDAFLLHDKSLPLTQVYYAPLQEEFDGSGKELYDPFLLTVPKHGKTEQNIFFMPSHREFTITITGWGNHSPAPVVEMQQLPSGYTFRCVTSAERLSYRIPTNPDIPEEGQYSVTFYTPYFNIDEEAGLALISSSDDQIILKHNLPELLDSHGVDPDYSGPIHIDFKFYSGDVIITLPGWDKVEIE